MTWPEVDLDRGTCSLRQHKEGMRGKSRTIYLTPEAVALLEHTPPDRRQGPVFLSRLGTPYTVAGLRWILRRAPHGITPHQLRHTFAQSLLDRGEPVEVIAGLLGHANLETAQTYARIKANHLRRVAGDLSSPVPPPLPSPPEDHHSDGE